MADPGVLVGAFWGEASWTEAEWGEVGVETGSILISWTPVAVPDADYYTVKYSPDTTTPWEECEEVYRTTSFLKFQEEETQCVVEDRYGQYLVACTDTSGNEGEPGQAIRDGGLADWVLLKSISGNPSWFGTTDEMYVQAPNLYLDLNSPIVNGVQTGTYVYQENVDFYIPVSIRIVDDQLIFNGQEDDVVTHEWRNVEGGHTDWKVFDDDVIDVLGTVEFRIKYISPDTDFAAINYVKFSRVLVYITDPKAGG